MRIGRSSRADLAGPALPIALSLSALAAPAHASNVALAGVSPGGAALILGARPVGAHPPGARMRLRTSRTATGSVARS